MVGIREPRLEAQLRLETLTVGSVFWLYLSYVLAYALACSLEAVSVEGLPLSLYRD